MPPYDHDTIERRLLTDDQEAQDRVSRWIAQVLASARFWALRPEWRDLHQEILLRTSAGLRVSMEPSATASRKKAEVPGCENDTPTRGPEPLTCGQCAASSSVEVYGIRPVEAAPNEIGRCFSEV